MRCACRILYEVCLPVSRSFVYIALDRILRTNFACFDRRLQAVSSLTSILSGEKCMCACHVCPSLSDVVFGSWDSFVIHHTPQPFFLDYVRCIPLNPWLLLRDSIRIKQYPPSSSPNTQSQSFLPALCLHPGNQPPSPDLFPPQSAESLTKNVLQSENRCFATGKRSRRCLKCTTVNSMIVMDSATRILMRSIFSWWKREVGILN